MRDREEEIRAEWDVPASVSFAPDVDLSRSDPAAQDTSQRRRCIALSKAGKRCRVNAMTGHLLCPAHSGHLDSSAGGRAKAMKDERRKAEAEERMVVAEMGARAVIRQAVLKNHAALTATIDGLMRDAEAGDRRAQQILLGYLTQGFGSPNVPAGETAPPDASDLSTLSTAELRALAMRPAAQPSD